MNNRWKSGLLALGLSVVAVPTIVAAHAHRASHVPATLALATPARVAHVAVPPVRSAHAVPHKKAAVVTVHKKATHKSKKKPAAKAKHHLKHK